MNARLPLYSVHAKRPDGTWLAWHVRALSVAQALIAFKLAHPRDLVQRIVKLPRIPG